MLRTKKYLRKLLAALTALSLFLLLLTSCAWTPGGGTGGDDVGTGDNTSDTGADEITDPGTEETPVDTERHTYTFLSKDGDTYAYTDGENTVTMTVTCESGTASALSVEGNTVTITGLAADSIFTFSGTFYGNIVVEGTEDFSCEVVFSGFSLTSYDACPVTFTGHDEATLSAKKGTENYIYDLRETVSDEEISAAVYADCDLSLQGKGALTVVSENNNGVHTKDDLKVKNLSLKVECEDNALKGNDSVKRRTPTSPQRANSAAPSRSRAARS